MTKRKHFKRRVRGRAAKTGESYTAALRHLRQSAQEARMSTTARNEIMLNCTFCSKDHKQVKKLIAGPGVYICDECIGLCNTILDEEPTGAASTEARAPSLDEGPVERLVQIFSGMAGTTRSLEDRLGEWARKLAERGVSVSTLAATAGITEDEATERFRL